MGRKKSPPDGKCVYCLKFPVKRTWDHVFPRSWYPDTTPKQNYKWQVPVCSPCNSKFGKIEDELRLRLGLCIDTTSASASGVGEGVLRAMDPNATDDQREKDIRGRKRAKILQEVSANESITEMTIYPGFEGNGDPTGRITIDNSLIGSFVRKLVRGIVYYESSKFINHPYEIHHYVVDNSLWQLTAQLLASKGLVHHNGPGIVICHAKANDDDDEKYISMFSILIWGKFKVTATVKTT